MVQIQDNDGALSIDTGDREPLKLWIDDVVSKVFIVGRHALHCCSHLGFKGIGAGICERLHHNIFFTVSTDSQSAISRPKTTFKLGGI